jgi:hypothetical protein
VSLRAFSGKDSRDYRDWIAEFRATIHANRTYNAVQKFSRLRSDAGYQQALDALDEQYGDRTHELNEILLGYSALETVNNMATAEQFKIEVELCRRLETAGGQPDNPAILAIVMSKLNRFWTDKVYQIRDQRPLVGAVLVQPWTKADFRTVFARAYNYQRKIAPQAKIFRK